jgi:tetratricopeptide (TPR) repeat protein
MKKIIFVLGLSLFGGLAMAQTAAVDEVMMKQVQKDKDKSDSDIKDEKAAAKAATWMDRAKTYQDIALQYSSLDSSAVMTAYEAYKKVVELDVNKKGAAGRLSKESSDILAGTSGNLYNAFVKQGAEHYQGQNMTKALALFQKAQEINKKDTLATLYGGIAAQQANKKDIAIDEFNKYMANGGKDASVYYGLAQIYRADNKFDQAIATLEKGLEHSPDNKDLKSEIVNIYLASGNEDMAIKKLQDLTAQDPSNVTNLVNLGILYDNINNERAKQIRALKEKTGGSGDEMESTTKQLDSEKDKLGIYDGEIKRITGLLKKQPKSADLKRQLDDVTTSRNEAKTYITKYEGEIKALADKANSPDKAKTEKDLADLQSKYDATKKDILGSYQKALAAEPENYDALFNLGVIYFNEAVVMKSEVDNMNMQQYQKTGKEAEGLFCGVFKKAKPYFEKAVKAKPDMEEASTTLETLNSVLSQLEEKKVKCVEAQ